MRKRGLNCGSGQRPFTSTPEVEWINIDVNPRWDPTIVADWNDLSMFQDGSVDYIVSHHSLEHAGCGEADGFLREANRTLKSGGSLLIFVPDMKALAARWLRGEISDYIFSVNAYGAYMGDEADRHKWLYTFESLSDILPKLGNWSRLERFDWRDIAGATIAKDWWILGFSATK